MTAAIVRAAGQGMLNPMSRWTLGLFALLPVVVPVGFWQLIGGDAALFSLGAIAAVAALSIWFSLVYNLQQQNHPQLARLLPGQVHGLRRTLLLSWAGLACAAFALSLLWLGDALRVGLPAALLLWLLAAAARWPWLWLLMWLPGTLMPLLFKWQPAAYTAWQAARGWAAEHVLLSIGLTLLIGAALLSRTIAAGDAGHQQRHRKAKIWRQSFAMQGRSAPAWQPGSLLDRLQRLSRRPYMAVLRWHVSRPGAPLRIGRIALMLGPQGHWTGHLTQLPILLAVVLLVLAVLLLMANMGRHGAELMQGMANVAIGAISYLVSVAQQMRAAVLRTGREQALLSLLPGLPGGGWLNRQLARWLMLQYLAQWLLVFGLLALLLSPWPQTHAQLLAFALAALPAGLGLWCDWSRARPLGALQMSLGYALPLLLGGLGLLALRQAWLDMLQLTLLVVGLSAALGLWRWRLALRAPPTFPAGRQAAC